MRSTGLVRNIDELGRLIIPIELRRAYSLIEKSPVEFFTTEDGILIRSYSPGCIHCGSPKFLIKLGDNNICGACVEKASKILGVGY